MPKPESQIPAKRSEMDGVSMRLMLELRNQPERLLGVSRDIGVPHLPLIDILDADLRRGRAPRVSEAWSTHTGQELLARLVSSREAFRKPGADPVLWLLRVRWHIRKAAYSSIIVQSGGHTADADRLYKRPSTSDLSYRALAAWACRCLPIQPEISEVCFEILGERQNGRRMYQFPTKETTAWLAWFARILGVEIPIPSAELGHGTFHGARWTDLGCSRSMAEAVLLGSAEAGYANPSGFNLAAKREEIRAYARGMGISYANARKVIQSERRAIKALGAEPVLEGRP